MLYATVEDVSSMEDEVRTEYDILSLTEGIEVEREPLSYGVRGLIRVVADLKERIRELEEEVHERTT